MLSDRMRRTTLSPGDHATVSVDVSTAVSTSGSVVGVMTSTASSPVPVCVSVAVVAEHVTLKAAWLGERKGVLEMRRMYGGYFKGHRNASQLRMRLMEHHTRDGVLDLLHTWRPEDEEVSVPVARDLARRVAIPARLPRKATLPTSTETAA